MMVAPSIIAAVHDKRLSPLDFQLFFVLAGTELSPVEFQELKVSAVALKMDRDEAQIRRSLLQLTRAGYLECEPRGRIGELAKYRWRWRANEDAIPQWARGRWYPPSPFPDSDRPSRARLVYVIRVRGGQRVKIGISERPLERLESISQESGIELELVVCFPGDMRDERTLHKRFASCRTKGEWFEPDASMRAWIIEMAELHSLQSPVPKVS